MLPGHLFDKVFFLIGVAIILGGVLGRRTEPHQRAITALTGLFIAFFTLKGVVPLSEGMQDVLGAVGLVTLLAVVALQWRARRSGGTAV